MFKRTWNTWNGSVGVGRWLRALGVGAALAATLPGCMAHARGELVYDYPVVTVEAAPTRIETYPRTYYHGQPAYLVEGRWYYRSGPRWVYFREEPRELRAYRVRHYDSPRSGERYSDAMADRRAERYRDERRAERYREERRAAERAQHRRADERRAEQRRAERRREERHAAEQRAAQRRLEERRAAEHRAAERRDAERRMEERRAEQKRDERKGRVAEKRPRDDRRRVRDRDRDDRDRRND